MPMKKQNPVITNSLVDRIVKLSAARRATRRRQNARFRHRMMLQVGRCFAEIAVPFFERKHRAKHPVSDTPEFNGKHHLPEHGNDPGDQV